MLVEIMSARAHVVKFYNTSTDRSRFESIKISVFQIY